MVRSATSCCCSLTDSNSNRLRNKAGLLLLIGIIPHRKKEGKKKIERNFEPYFDIVLAELKELYLEGTGSKGWQRCKADVSLSVGLICFDAALERNIVSKVYLLFATADLRGVPHLNSQMQAPCYNGACDQCRAKGVKLKGDKRTIYPELWR
jgi:hypothetical protein